MKKKLLGLLLFVQGVHIQSQDAIEDYPSAVDAQAMTNEPMHSDMSDVVQTGDSDNACENKGFLCKLLEAIKNFFKNIIQKIKSLFSASEESKVEMVVQPDDVREDDNHNNDGENADEAQDIKELHEAEDDQDDEALRVSSAERKILSQEPSWLQQRS